VFADIKRSHLLHYLPAMTAPAEKSLPLARQGLAQPVRGEVLPGVCGTQLTEDAPPAIRHARYPLPMPESPKVQKTPEGYEIPVPTRGEFDANLDKLLRAPQPPKRVAGRRQAGGGRPKAPDGG
jgi:hypothetical protein